MFQHLASSATRRSGLPHWRAHQWLALGLLAGWLLLALLFAQQGLPKPLAAWHALDIAGEGCLALLAGAWALVVLDSRPAGRVTRWLGAGLALLSLSAGADLMDEFFTLPAQAVLLRWLESGLTPPGLLALSVGLVLWRQEQQVIGLQLAGREGGLRDHRSFDQLTRLADAGHLRRVLEQALDTPASGSLVMLELASRSAAERLHGRRAGQQLMRAVVQMVLLNLRPDDLLCRYGGDRLVLWLPGTPLAEAHQRASALQRMAEALHTYAARHGPALGAQLRVALQPLDGEALAQAAAGRPAPGPAAAAAASVQVRAQAPLSALCRLLDEAGGPGEASAAATAGCAAAR
ncbi:GGDEF domain-containing protein [Aquabacterium sp. OR-4]|uniref:GGDEF domain-containing protein n=1 Tax=Aquabacterium sp. OR-4 TaxID=2978127 RepID=UPI0021B3ED54|nr:GGDEF domain-containing protein [Aquabacterium sp. OR-4]MDT7838219.1 GGDEF domain-containing protein [Aquabacterium sp. OR-4]